MIQDTRPLDPSREYDCDECGEQAAFNVFGYVFVFPAEQFTLVAQLCPACLCGYEKKVGDSIRKIGATSAR